MDKRAEDLEVRAYQIAKQLERLGIRGDVTHDSIDTVAVKVNGEGALRLAIYLAGVNLAAATVQSIIRAFKGQGQFPPYAEAKCPVCDGTGTEMFPTKRVCRRCGGKGKVTDG